MSLAHPECWMMLGRRACGSVLLLGTLAACVLASEDVGYTFGAHYDSICLATVSASIQLQHKEGVAYFAEVSPGLRGGKISLGCGIDESAGVCGPVEGSWVNTFILAGKMTYLRMWEPTRRFESRQNYLGMEFELAFILDGSIGLFKGLNTGRKGPDWVVGASVGIGL
jgi:hypothetical protein